MIQACGLGPSHCMRAAGSGGAQRQPGTATFLDEYGRVQHFVLTTSCRYINMHKIPLQVVCGRLAEEAAREALNASPGAQRVLDEYVRVQNFVLAASYMYVNSSYLYVNSSYLYMNVNSSFLYINVF